MSALPCLARPGRDWIHSESLANNEVWQALRKINQNLIKIDKKAIINMGMGFHGLASKEKEVKSYVRLDNLTANIY